MAYNQQANQYAQDYQTSLQASAVLLPPAAAFPPPSTSPLGKALNDPKVLQDPISATIRGNNRRRSRPPSSNYQTSLKNAEDTYQKLAKLTPNDPNAQYQLGSPADAAGDSKVALACVPGGDQARPGEDGPLRVLRRKQRIKALAAGDQEVDSRPLRHAPNRGDR